LIASRWRVKNDERKRREGRAMIYRFLQFIAVSAAVYFVFPLAFDYPVDAVQAVSITLLTYLFGLIIAQPQEAQPVSISVVNQKEDVNFDEE
jgi:uncharacterized membrane protein YbhN (UPF0104 family)